MQKTIYVVLFVIFFLCYASLKNQITGLQNKLLNMNMALSNIEAQVVEIRLTHGDAASVPSS